MGDKSKIQWTDATWNPIRARRKDTGKTGYHCERVSPACQHCYAATFNRRGMAVGTGLDYTVPNRENVEIYLDEKTLMEPLKWKRPRKIFVCSMTDLFGEFVPDHLIDKVHAVMALCPKHTFLTLTKRAVRLESYSGTVHAHHLNRFSDIRKWMALLTRSIMPEVDWPLGNVWRGVTAEDQQRADERIPHLLRTPAAKRFVSVEPMLGRVNLQKWLYALDWVIVGGESGSGARGMDVAWVRALRDQCYAMRVACFIKQMGARPFETNIDRAIKNDDVVSIAAKSAPWLQGFTRITDSEGTYLRKNWKLTDRKGGDMAEWPEDLRVREVPV